MSDLDEELFGKSTKASKKSADDQVSSFQKKVSFDGSDINLDDPLEGLLSSDEDEPPVTVKSKPNIETSSKKTSDAKISRSVKKDQLDDDFFDDDDDLADVLGIDDDKIPEKSLMKTNPATILDDILGKSSVKTRPESSSTTRSLRFDKDGNFIKTKDEIEREKTSFGSYQPSITTGKAKSINGSRRPSVSSGDATNDHFFDFLLEDNDTRKSKSVKPEPRSSKTIQKNPKINDSNPKEVDIASILSEDKPSSASSLKHQSTEKAPRRSDVGPVSRRRASATPLTSSPLLTEKPPQPVQSSVGKNFRSKEDVETALIDDLISGGSLQDPQKASQKSTSAVPTPMKNLADHVILSNPKIIPKVPDQDLSNDQDVSTLIKIQSLETQVSRLTALLHQTELGYHNDQQLAQQAHNSRVELLQRSLTDIRSRADREVASIRHSYALHADAVREQSRDHLRLLEERENDETMEVMRMRKIHEKLVEDLRKDHCHEIEVLKSSHLKEVEAISSYGHYTKNLDKMLKQVDEATSSLQKLTEKHDSTLQKIEEQNQVTTSSNQQFLNTIETQLNRMDKMMKEANSNYQEMIKRFDSRFNEINQKFEDHLFVLNGELTRVSSAQSLLDEDRKMFNQQITAEKEHIRKAQTDAIELQQKFERQLRHDRERQDRIAEELREESRIRSQSLRSELDRIGSREEQLKLLNEELIRERSAVNQRSEKVDQEKILISKKSEEAESRLKKVKEQEEAIKRRFEDLNDQFKEMQKKKQEDDARIQEAERAFQKAQDIENQQTSRMRALRDLSEDVVMQRRKLAEERKFTAEQLASRDLSNRPIRTDSLPAGEANQILVSELLQSANLPQAKFSELRSSGASQFLWQHVAQKDRFFLDKEKFYLESLKHSPHNATQ